MENRRANSITKRIISHVLILMMILSLATGILPSEAVYAASTDTTSTVTPKIKLNHKTLKVRAGKSKKLVLKNATGKIKWKSNKKSVVKVTKKGKIIAKKKGKATITATYKGEKYKCKVTVLAKKKSKKKSGKSKASGSGTVYWVASGEVYHSTSNCPTLSRSKSIYKGSVSQSGKSRKCKVCY